MTEEQSEPKEPRRNELRPDEPRPNVISKTAIWVAAARAIGAREPDVSVRNPDYLAEQLLGDDAQRVLDHPVVSSLSIGYEDAMQNIEVADTVRAMIERSRFIDERLEHAIAAGATQVLIPGAGLDSHAYRYRDLLADVSVYEADRPVTLEFKQRRVAEALGGPPPNLKYVPVDFQRETLLGALAQHGYDVTQRTFVILEGVTMYLSEDALRELFRFVAAHAPGSRVVFDYTTRTMIETIRRIDPASIPAQARPPLERFLNIISDEPWFFGFIPDGEREYLEELGLELGELLTIGSDESGERYLTRADGTTVGGETHAKTQAMRKAAQDHALAQVDPKGRQVHEQRMREHEKQMAYRIAEAVVRGDAAQELT